MIKGGTLMILNLCHWSVFDQGTVIDPEEGRVSGSQLVEWHWSGWSGTGVVEVELDWLEWH